jgi:hypothetical protein
LHMLYPFVVGWLQVSVRACGPCFRQARAKKGGWEKKL